MVAVLRLGCPSYSAPILQLQYTSATVTITNITQPISDHSLQFSRHMRSSYTSVMSIVIYIELLVGLVSQLLNLLVLGPGTKRIRSKRYSMYARALCATQLLAIAACLLSHLRMNNWFDGFASIYIIVASSAYVELYLVNVMICSVNMLSLQLVVQTWLSLRNPFRDRADANQYKSSARGIGLSLLIPALCLLPITLVKEVETMNAQATQVQYCVGRRQFSDSFDRLLHVVRVLSTGAFEMGLFLVVILMYALIFAKYRNIMRLSQRIRQSSSQPKLARSTKASVPLIKNDVEMAVLKEQFMVPRKSRLRSLRLRLLAQHPVKALQLCIACVGSYSIANLPSVLKESLNLAYFCTGWSPLGALFTEQNGRVFTDVCTLALFSTFTLSVLLHMMTSRQYRKCMLTRIRRLFCCTQPSYEQT